MPCNMTAYINCAREACYVRGVYFYIHCERGVSPAEALRTNAEGVDLFKQTSFHIGVIRVRVALVGRAGQSAL